MSSGLAANASMLVGYNLEDDLTQVPRSMETLLDSYGIVSMQTHR